MIDIEKIAQSFLASVPRYIWDGVGLPVPIEEIADSYAGLLVRDVVDLTTAPGAPLLAGGQSLSGLLLPARGEIWVNRCRSSGMAGTTALHHRSRAGALVPASQHRALRLLPNRDHRC